MATTTALSSAAALLSLLEEDDPQLQQHALAQLDKVVDQFWPEIAQTQHITKIETLVEDESFESRQLAAVVASKVFYHLEELDVSLRYALGADGLFDVGATDNLYVQTLTAKSIDEYIRLSRLADSAPASSPPPPIDSRLVAVVERMFERCHLDAAYTQAVGIAIESHRLDQLAKTIQVAPESERADLLTYSYQLSHTVNMTHKLRLDLLRLLVQLYHNQAQPNLNQVAQCLLFLDDAQAVAETLHKLVEKDDIDSALLAYQIGFDLGENQNWPFLQRVSAALPEAPEQDDEAPSTTTTSVAAPVVPSTSAAANVSMTDTASTSLLGAEATSAANTLPSNTHDTSAAMDTDDSTSSSAVKPPLVSYSTRMRTLRRILSGEAAIDLHLHFLYEHNATDLNILKMIKDKLEARNSVTHNATVMAHGIMHCGTTVDVFLRDNLDWLSRAQNWAKFTATASIGVIHKGHIQDSLKILEPYLPTNGGAGSPYQEGGALYALGLIHSSHGSDKIDYLTKALSTAMNPPNNNEIVQHGACLGLGLCAMSTNSTPLFESLKAIVMTESAVAGEAAGYAMGLVLLGSGRGTCIEEMLAYAHETHHDKIIRGLAMGIALIEYGREEEADVVIEQLLSDKDPILRYGGMYAIGLAYACTANNAAVQKLLHVAVSDVSDDVRRAAVTCLGFVLANVPEQVPRVVSLLAESYNPHVRYGAALAVGIACAGGGEAGRTEALAILEPLLKDRTDFVRQGAFLGMAMICIQHNEVSEPKVAVLRKAIDEAMNIKSDTMTKLGAILAAGIVDAGGRNLTISLLSPSGHKRMAAIVGLALYPQFWYWYPLIHLLSLAFTPTALIGLNANLKIPKPFTVVALAKPSLFAYPKPIQLNKVEEKKVVKHAQLSGTMKAKAKLKKKEEEKATEKATADAMDGIEKTEQKESKESDKATPMDVDTAEETKTTENTMSSTTTGADDKKDGDEKVVENEPNFTILHNPARVTLAQQKFLSFPPTQRYRPVSGALTGSTIIMLKDTTPGHPETLVQGKSPKIGVPGVSDDEPEPPATFEYTG